MTAPISNGPTTHGYTTMRDATGNPEQGRYFFHSTPIAMRHGGNARRVSVSVSFPWAQQMIAMRWTSAVRETCRWRHTTSRLASITDAHDERKFALLWLALTEA